MLHVLGIVTAVLELGIAVAGLVLSELGKIGKGEPVFVLRLSWLALVFAATTTLFAS